MPAKHHEPVGGLTRDQQKQLLELACAADRLEWQIQAKRLSGTTRRSLAIASLLRAGVGWLPRVAALAPARRRPSWRRALMLIQAGLGLFS